VQVPLAELEEADWDAVMNTNLKSVWMCMKIQIPAMLKRRKGAIVNISSIYGNTDDNFSVACVSDRTQLGRS
jgi:NADP-dependent 3-hydroxy acid dehydrogenase YdfG